MPRENTVELLGKRVSLRALKDFVLKRLPRDSVTRELIMSEDDAILAIEFIGKIKPWLRAMEMRAPGDGVIDNTLSRGEL
jgi:hypothetical protein